MIRIINLLTIIILFGINNTANSNNIFSVIPKINNSTNNNFNGTWNYEFNSDENELLNRTFELKLSSKKDIIYGQYCAVAKGGRKIDCNDKQIYNISGIIKNDIAYVDFTGFLDKKAKGKAKIYFDGESLIWEIITVDGEIAAPKKAMMKNSKLVSNENNIEGLYILETCENSRFKIKIIKQDNIYSFVITDKNKSISKGLVKIENIKKKIYLTFGKIGGISKDNEIQIQNYGNSINEYNHFTQCEEKYLSFIKQ